MRPAILFPLFADIRTLPGVGPKLEKLITKVAGPKLADLAFDLPVGVVDRSYRPRLAAAEPGRIATVEVNVLTTCRRGSKASLVKCGLPTTALGDTRHGRERARVP